MKQQKTAPLEKSAFFTFLRLLLLDHVHDHQYDRKKSDQKNHSQYNANDQLLGGGKLDGVVIPDVC